MTTYQLKGRLVKLEQHAHITRSVLPYAQRRDQIHAMLLQAGVAPQEVESTYARLLAMTPAERAAWIRERRA